MSNQANQAYAEFIRNLPEADMPLEGARGFILGAPQAQAVFFELEAGTEIPIHTHGDQWGVVVSGELEFTMGDETHHRKAGDYYFVPAGTPHGAKIITEARIIEVFDDANRWKPK